MHQRIDHTALPACGYAVPWSVRAGETVRLHASTVDPCATVGLIRLDRPEAPVWPVIRLDDPLAHRSFRRGSWAQIDGLPEPRQGTLTVEALLTRNETPRTLLGWGDVAITVDPAGRIQLRVGVRRAADERTAARRADIAFRTHEGGGFVLSVGSVAWCGALPEAGQENPVGTLTRNILFHLKGDRS